MKTVLLVILACTFLFALTTASDLREKVFSDPDLIQCSKDKPCPADSPCCTVHGFCGSRRYHCLRKFACAFGCKEDDSQQSSLQESPTKTLGQAQKVVIKTISTPVPVCKNCNKAPEAAAQKKVVTEQKRLEDTVETVTERKPPAAAEKEPKCLVQPCPGAQAQAAPVQPKTIVVQVTGRSLSDTRHPVTVPLTYTAGNDASTNNVLDPKGY